MQEEELQHAETYRDRVSTVNEGGKRNWVYALKPKGDWYKKRKILAYFYLAIFLIMPFIKVNGLPFLMINVVEGKFILFSKIFWPQDFFIFAIGMITFIIFIVLFTVAFGRLFCGWVCPQTIFLEFIFRPIEWAIEGSPNQQRKLNELKWTKTWIYKKTLKHFIYFLISFIIAHTFLSYVIGIDEVIKIIKEPLADHLGLFFGLFVFTFLFYGVFAFLREIVCTTICPYGRLQGVMFDKDTMQIAYDFKRGEPRGKLKKGEQRTDGDCINCFKCVQVCPTAIDIRDGLQMECVGCTACADACDEVMDVLHLDRGLIRYASENELNGGKKIHFNGRIKAYTGLLLVLFVAMISLVATRNTIDTYISRVKGQLFQKVGEDKLSNLYDAKIINKTKIPTTVVLKLEDLNGTFNIIGKKDIVLLPESINEFTFFLEIPKKAIKERNSNIKISVYSGDKKIQTIKTKFLGPFI